MLVHLFADSVYQEMEREKFAALESKARSDKNVMMSRLLHAAYVGVSESLCEAMVESPVGSFVPLTPSLPGIMMSSDFLVTDNPFSPVRRICTSMHYPGRLTYTSWHRWFK